MAKVKFDKPEVKILYATDMSEPRWYCEVNGRGYMSLPNLHELLKVLVQRTVISYNDAEEIKKRFKGNYVSGGCDMD